MSPWWKLDPYNVNRENRDQRERVAADGVSSVARGGGRIEAASRAASAFSATRTVPPGATSPGRRDPGPVPGGGGGRLRARAAGGGTAHGVEHPAEPVPEPARGQLSRLARRRA